VPVTVVDDLVAEAARLDTILGLLTEAQWHAESAADGWSVGHWPARSSSLRVVRTYA